MRCPSCGQRLSDGAKRCPSCGLPIDETMIDTASEETTDTNEGAGEWHERQTDTYTDAYTDDAANNADYTTQQSYDRQPENSRRYMPMKMKWYKFLIYVSLLLTGASNIIGGVQYLMEKQYETAEVAAQVYATYPNMFYVDKAYGVVSILLGLLALVARQKLAHYKSDGPTWLIRLYAVALVITLGYFIISMVATGNFTIGIYQASYIIAEILVSAFMIAVNRVYFKKREHLFVN